VNLQQSVPVKKRVRLPTIARLMTSMLEHRPWWLRLSALERRLRRRHELDAPRCGNSGRIWSAASSA
jgi:hypothetical protein